MNLIRVIEARNLAPNGDAKRLAFFTPNVFFQIGSLPKISILVNDRLLSSDPVDESPILRQKKLKLKRIDQNANHKPEVQEQLFVAVKRW